MENYVAYYRVSTNKQGNSGLGLEAQKTNVQKFVGCVDCIISEFVEIESGKKTDKQRPQLKAAILEAKKLNATLIVSKLDRLSRNAAFLLELQASGLKLLFADMPTANELQVGIMAVLAQFEAKQISERTKSALNEKKKQGVKLGNPQNLTKEAQIKGNETKTANAKEFHKTAISLSKSMRANGSTFEAIANELNRIGLTTKTGKKYSKVAVKRLIEKY